MFETARPRERRRADTIQEILDAAWRLARRDGLAAISLRDLAAEVGLKAPSLYGYFASKGDLYDAMFRRGNEAFLAELAPVPAEGLDQRAARTLLCERTARFLALCNEDPVRYQLLFQRSIPGWEPSAEAYALAQELVARLQGALDAAGIRDERAVDLWTALTSGLAAQQLSNEPGGDRWLRLTDDACAMFFAFLDTPGGAR